MTSVEIISLVVTAMGVCSFSAIFTILYRNYTAASVKEVVTGKADIDLIDECIYNSQKNTIRRREIFATVRSAVFYALLVVFVPVFVFSAISKFNGDVMMFGGRSLMVVASGSMSEKNSANDYLKNYDNQFDTYDIIILSEVENSSKLKKYDVIAFVNDDGINVIHRIVGFDYSSGELRYKTRGDSNNADDEYKPSFDDVIGIYTNKKIDTLGIFVMFFQSYGGMVTIAALIYCLIMMDSFNKRLQTVQKERIEKLRSAIDLDTLSSAKEVTTEFTERIYYKGYAYIFDDSGFVEKQEVAQGELEEKPEGTMIKVVETSESRTSEEIIIQSEEE